MQIALLSCYEALLDGLTKALNNLPALSKLGWGQPEYDALQQKLVDIRAAEQNLFSVTAALDARMADAQAALNTLAPLLVAVGAGQPEPTGESSFRYSTSLSNSTSEDWRFPSGGVWVTDSSGYRVPNGCPGASSSSSSSGARAATGTANGPGDYAMQKVMAGKTAEK